LKFEVVVLAAALAAGGCTGSDGTDGMNGAAGASGANGANSLVMTSVEQPGANCATGGTKLDIGIDTDGDGALSASEIEQTVYVCNGADGTDGTDGDDGADGLRGLVSVTAEDPGANCAGGGQRIDYGVDDDSSGTLDAGEIDGTSYVCNGTDGLVSLIATTTELPGNNCTLGGTRITSGIDDDNSGVLDASEVDATTYVCDAVPAGTLYLSQDNNSDGLYRLDVHTGAATHLGVSGTLGSTLGLTYDPVEGVLLGSKWTSLLAIQPDGSGVVDRGGASAEALAYDYVNQVLYGAFNASFFTMDPTTGAKLTDLGFGPGDVEGLAFRADIGVIYGASSGSTSLFAYDIASNTWSTVGTIGMDMARCGLTYDPWSHTLYATRGGDGKLYRIDPVTAEATLVGPTGLAKADGGLEYVPLVYP
jgi:hypothetical protein